MTTVMGLTFNPAVVSDTDGLMLKGSHHRIAVIGTGEFPMDMLRYDRCWPAEGILRQSGDQRIVVLESHPSDTSPWTTARWASFGWTVINERMVDRS